MQNSGTPVDGVIVRQARDTDADAIGVLWEQLVAYHRALDTRLPQATTNGGRLYARQIQDRLNDTFSRIYVAVDPDREERVVGFVVGVVVDLVPEMFVPEKGGFLADIFVSADYRKRGVGRALVEALADWFRSRGVQHIELYVAARNQEGRSFWEALDGDEVMIRVRMEL
jgi:GNAT superfamily N-acetyltransferase